MTGCDTETPPLQPIPRKISITALSDSETLFEESLSPKPKAESIFRLENSHIEIGKGEDDGEKRTREEFCSRPRLTGAQWSQGLREHLGVVRKIREFKARGFSNEKIAEELPEYYYMDDYHADEILEARRGKESS